MDKNGLSWIPCSGMDLNPINTAASEMLDKYGFALIFNEFGSEKLTKVELCIFNLIRNKDRANILLVCPDHEMYNWYRILVTGIGIDFKIITGSDNSLLFFSQEISNLHIVSQSTYKALSSNENYRKAIENDFAWDLLIIDEEQNIGGIDYDSYCKSLTKTENFILIASMPLIKKGDRDGLLELIKTVMVDAEKARFAETLVFDKTCVAYNTANPVMRYYHPRVYSGEQPRNIVEITYKIPEATINTARRILDLKTTLPLYKYGGNVFEEYDVPARRIYSKPVYSVEDVEALKETDKKLEAFLKYFDTVHSDPSARSIIYCTTEATITYLKKVINAVYANETNFLSVATGMLFKRADVLRKFRTSDVRKYPRVILAVDHLGAVGDGLDRITHVFNYELPESPAVLEQRMTRHGTRLENQRVFIYFADENGIFDSKMLQKCLISRISTGLLRDIPSRNILFNFPKISYHLAKCIYDLKYINSYATEVESCFDLIKQFKADYLVPDNVSISNSKQLVDITAAMINNLMHLFDIDENLSAHPEVAQIEKLFAPVLKSLSGALLYLTDTNRIKALKDKELKAMLYSAAYQSALSQSQSSPIQQGIRNAKATIDANYGSDEFTAKLRDAVSSYDYRMQLSILYGVWRYRAREIGTSKSFKKFIKIFNEGVE